MSHVTDAQAGLPPGRYGSPRKLPRWVAALLILGCLIAVAPVTYSVVHRANPAARGTVTGFTVLDDNRVRATVDLHKGSGVSEVSCTLRARNKYSETVGSAAARLLGPATSGVIEREFPTSDRAVIVEVTGCVATDGG